VLSEKLHAGALILNLMDTAGIRESRDVIERMGVERTMECAREADLILWVIDASATLNPDDFTVWDIIKGHKNVIGLLNKADLPPVLTDLALKAQFDIPFFSVSALYDMGLDGLKSYIQGIFSSGDITPGDLLSAERHKQAGERAAGYLNGALAAAESGLPDELISVDLSEAISALGEITGENAGEDLIDRIFSAFCVGK